MRHRRIRTLVLAGISCAVLFGCSQTVSNTSNDEYVLATLKSGDRAQGKSDAERTAIQAAHMNNIQKLAHEGTLVVAGPYGKENHDSTARGIFVFDVRTLAEARTLAETDPAVIAGVLALEVEPLRTDADLRGAVRADLDAEAEAKRTGRERPMSDRIRSYVILRADDRTRSEKSLSRLLPPGVVIISARVGTDDGLYVLDAPDCATVRHWLGTEIDSLGPCTIDEWWSSKHLVRAASPGP